MNELQANAAALVAAQEPIREDFRVYTKYDGPADFERVSVTGNTKPDLLRFEVPGASVGRLWVDANGVFQFEGNVGEAARILFEALSRLSEQSRKGD